MKKLKPLADIEHVLESIFLKIIREDETFSMVPVGHETPGYEVTYLTKDEAAQLFEDCPWAWEACDPPQEAEHEPKKAKTKNTTITREYKGDTYALCDFDTFRQRMSMHDLIFARSFNRSFEPIELYSVHSEFDPIDPTDEVIEEWVNNSDITDARLIPWAWDKVNEPEQEEHHLEAEHVPKQGTGIPFKHPCIQCSTQELYDRVRSTAHIKGLKWNSGKSFECADTIWSTSYKENTFLNLVTGHFGDCLDQNDKNIIQAEDWLAVHENPVEVIPVFLASKEEDLAPKYDADPYEKPRLSEVPFELLSASHKREQDGLGALFFDIHLELFKYNELPVGECDVMANTFEELLKQHPELLRRMATAYQVGTAKYQHASWRKGFGEGGARRLAEAFLRHYQSWAEGKDFDGETGIEGFPKGNDHLGAAVFSLFTMMVELKWYDINGRRV